MQITCTGKFARVCFSNWSERNISILRFQGHCARPTHRLQCSGENICVQLTVSFLLHSYNQNWAVWMRRLHSNRFENTPSNTHPHNLFKLHSTLQNSEWSFCMWCSQGLHSEFRIQAFEQRQYLVDLVVCGHYWRKKTIQGRLCALICVGRTKRLWEMLNTCLEYNGSERLANKFGSVPTPSEGVSWTKILADSIYIWT